MIPKYSAVLIRYGEIGIKSNQTRRRMVKLLVKHIKTALKEKQVSYKKVIIEYGRIFVESEDAHEVAIVTSQIFGIVSTSPVVVVDSSLDIILDVESYTKSDLYPMRFQIFKIFLLLTLFSIHFLIFNFDYLWF